MGVLEIRSRKQKVFVAIFAVIDAVFSLLFIAPVVIGNWRGTWQLMDKFLFAGKSEYSLWSSMAIGVVSGIVFCLLQNCLSSVFDYKSRPVMHFLAARIYTTVYCVCCVNHWRGVWMAWDVYTGKTWQSGVTSIGIGLFALALTRGLKNILAPPFFVGVDKPEDYFSVETLFKTKKQKKWKFFILDTCFTVIWTGSLVVFVWRGTWIFLDSVLFPEYPRYSAWGSMVIGMSINSLAFLSQAAMLPCLASINKGIVKLVIEDLYHTICFIGALNQWRGVWNILNIYLLPDKPVLSDAITSAGGLLILMIFYCSNSILVRGAQMDGDREGSDGVRFNTNYFRYFFRDQLTKNGQVDFWMAGAHTQTPPSVRPIPLGKHSKLNGMLENRGLGDGRSCSEVLAEAFAEERAISLLDSSFSRQPGARPTVQQNFFGVCRDPDESETAI